MEQIALNLLLVCTVLINLHDILIVLFRKDMF